MALKVELFPIDRSTREPAALNELLRKIRADGVLSISIVEMPGGGFAYSVAYEERPMKRVASSPPDGQTGVAVSTQVHVIFDEDLPTDASKVLSHLTAYRNGAAVTLGTADLSINRNRLTIGTTLVSVTAGAYYQLVLYGTLSGSSGRTLEKDQVLTWKTA